jgi:hypothetical protein
MTSEHHPGPAEQQAVLAAARAMLHGDDQAAHDAAATAPCPACATMAAIAFGWAIAAELDGARVTSAPFRVQMLGFIAQAQRDIREAQN